MLIAWDEASKEGDYSCRIYGKIDKEGNWHVDKVKIYKKKEGGINGNKQISKRCSI